jgi:hypothetical protein
MFEGRMWTEDEIVSLCGITAMSRGAMCKWAEQEIERQKRSKKIPEKSPEKISEKIPEKTVEKIPEKIRRTTHTSTTVFTTRQMLFLAEKIVFKQEYVHGMMIHGSFIIEVVRVDFSKKNKKVEKIV